MMSEPEEPRRVSQEQKMTGDSTTDSPSPPLINQTPQTTTSNSKSIIQDEPCNHHLREQQQSTDDDDSDSERCGICLSDGGRKAIRGKINSCDHFFCFICIMEWAKVESRCPMCKRRFTVIHRPPKEGVFASERVITVPQRDQVYHLFGNATSGPFDLYAEVKCSLHTYCVGLGATVPNGDWFCHDCALSRSKHDKTEVDTDTDDQMISANSNFENQISQYLKDIMQVSSLPNYFPPAIIPGCKSRSAEKVSCPSESRNTVGNSTESGARTLRLCHNVHSRIRALRENWRALQSRSLSFSSTMAESGSGKPIKVLLSLRETLYDIDKAWKMMNIAKSMQKNCKRTSSLNQTSIKLSCLGNASKEAISSSGLHISKIQRNETRNEERMGKQKHYRYNNHEREKEKHKSPEMENQKMMVMHIESMLQGSTDSLEVGVSKLDLPEGRSRLDKCCSKSKDRKDDNVKRVDAFKEIARLATHTILAASGFKHSKSSIHSFPSSLCSHTEDIK
ncbi:hypothetical protein CRYUN_Cryun19dG0025800 [Craigia yunnanensis]